MKLGKNNMYKKDKVIVVSGCFLKVKMLEFLTSTYVELLDKSVYKETFEETRRHQNMSQGLTNVKDNVFFIKVDKIKSQLYEQAFHMQGSNVLNFVNEKLSKNVEVFNPFKHLLQNFDFNESFLKCDVNMALKSLKELYDDMIWRCCRVADNQFRKDMIKVFRKQKTDTLRKRVVESSAESSASSVLKDSTTTITMMYIHNDDSAGKLRSHLKIQSLMLETGPLVLKEFTKHNYLILLTLLSHKSTDIPIQRTAIGEANGYCITTGYFVSLLGPYIARNNDATILNHIMHSNLEDIRSWVQGEDIFVVDHGFKDSMDCLEQMGIIAKMPSFLNKGDKQMSTENANTSRLVTKIRWVVESANARIKQWRYLRHILPSSQIPYIGDFVRIICGICNRYPKPLASGDTEEDQALGAKLIFLSKQVNTLQHHIEENHLDRRSVCWKEIDDLLDFPNMDEEQLKAITCGVYQLRLSPSYVQENEGECSIQIHRQEPGLLRVELQSRHVSSRSYLLWIQYGEGEVKAWYCMCRAGARFVGMCSYVAAILWYLGYARHQRDEKLGVRDWGEFVDDATLVDDSDSSSESDESEPEE